MPPCNLYRFEDITLDVATMRLARGDLELALEPKSFRLLQFLVENRHRVLGKEEIFRVVWPETAVSDNALTRAIAQIRKVLDDDPKEPRYIETVPTVGYRFIAPVTEDIPVPQPKPAPRKKPLVPIFAAIAVALLLAAGLVAWRLWPRPAPAPMSPPVRLTTLRGFQTYPSFSPDGNMVAFQWGGEKNDNSDIYITTLGPNAVPLRLTTNPAPDYYPAWSPDGATIAFQRLVSANFLDLMIIPALGGAERKLAEFPTLAGSFGSIPTWSSDSKWLIVPARAPDGMALFRVSAETGESIQITHPDPPMEESFPAISQDGSALIFASHPHLFNTCNIYQVRLDGSAKPVEAPRLLLPRSEKIAVHSLAWMPDSKEILAGTNTGITRLRADGSQSPTETLWMGGGPGSLALSRQGSRLAYSMPSGDTNIWRIDLTAKSPQPALLIASTARDVYPRYSPDGSRIAFYSNRTGLSQIYLSDSEGKSTQQITFVKQGFAGSPHWSPDGRTITFDSTQTGPSEVYSISAGGGPMQQLTQGPAANFGGTWSRDGASLYIGSTRTGRDEIWKIPAGGGPATQITQNSGSGSIVSPDGKTLYFAKEMGQGSIWKMPVDGGPEKQVTDSLYRTNFAVTTRGIYYMACPGKDGKSALKFYDFATGKSTLILNIGYPEFGLDVSPDGRFLAYAQLDDPGSVLMMVENFH